MPPREVTSNSSEVGKDLEHRKHRVHLSVVVPCRNVGPYVEQWRSIIEQDGETGSGIQWVFVDDASTDNAFNEIRKISHSDLVILSLDTQSGPGAARNAGLRQCVGDFVVFADADDFINISAVRDGVREALNRADGAGPSDVIAFQYAVKRDDGDIAFRSRARDGASLAQLLTRHVAIWRFAWRTDFLKSEKLEFSPLSYGEDLLFCFSAALSKPRVNVRQEVAYVYRDRHEGSATFGCSWTRQVDAVLTALESLRRIAPPSERPALDAWAVRIAMRAAITPCPTLLAVRWRNLRLAMGSIPTRRQDWRSFARAMSVPTALRKSQ